MEGTMTYVKDQAVNIDCTYKQTKALLYYKGSVKDGKFLTGLARYKDGREYVGDFNNQLFHGNGVLKKEQGKIVYEGLFQNGNYNGKGSLAINKKFAQRLTGIFKDGKLNGPGEQVLLNEDKSYTILKGNFSAGSLEG